MQKNSPLTSLKKAVTLQLAMTLAVLPFCAFWGLPVSLASIAGNLVHGVFLTSFLFLSSLLVCAVTLNLPTGPLVWLLTQLQAWWDYVLRFGSASWLVTVTPLHVYVIFFCIVLWSAWRWPIVRPYSWAALLLLSGSIAHRITQPHLPTVITRNGKRCSCVPQFDGSITLYDHGLIARTVDTQQLLTYVVQPHLRTTYGVDRATVIGSGKRFAYAQRFLNPAPS